MNENEGKVEIDKDVFDKLSALPGVVEGLVEELKTERKAKQDAETAAAKAIADAAVVSPATPPADATPEDPAKVVERILAERDAASAVVVRENAEAKFKAAHKEFASDNDPAGIKFAAFKTVLARLNTSGLTTDEQFQAVFNDALTLMNRQVAPEERIITPYADTPSDGGTPGHTDPNGTSAKEKKLYEGLGWTEEKYLKMKKSRPAYVEEMLSYAK